jgi:hypothetical protein
MPSFFIICPDRNNAARTDRRLIGIIPDGLEEFANEARPNFSSADPKRTLGAAQK